MKNRGLIVLIAIMAIMGCLFFVGCDDDDGDNNNNNNNGNEGLSTGVPPTNTLDAVGISETQFNAIRDAGGANNFLGWNYEEIEVGVSMKVISMMWSNRSRDDFDAVIDYLEDNFSSSISVVEDNELIYYMGSEGDWALQFHLSANTNQAGFTFSAGTMVAMLMKQN